jgi:uncharacterized protein YebE (UPF0316 family)
MVIDQAFLNSSLFQYGIMPLLIFVARICDVAISTVRLMMLYRGRRILAPILGFVEVLIWLLAVRQIMYNLNNGVTYLAFAGGFAMGNYVGILLEERLAVGLEVIRIITKNQVEDLIESLNAQGYGATRVEAEGSTGKVNIIFTIVPRKHNKKVIEIIHRLLPKAFYTVEEVKSVSEGIFPMPLSGYRRPF